MLHTEQNFNKKSIRNSLFISTILLTFLVTCYEASAQVCKFSTDESCNDNISKTMGSGPVTFCLDTPEAQPVNYNCTWQDNSSLMSGSSPGGFKTATVTLDRYRGILTCKITGPTTCTAAVTLVAPPGEYSATNKQSYIYGSWYSASVNNPPLASQKKLGGTGGYACKGDWVSFKAYPIHNDSDGLAQVSCWEEWESPPLPGLTSFYVNNNVPSPSRTLIVPLTSDTYESPWRLVPAPQDDDGDSRYVCSIRQGGVDAPPNIINNASSSFFVLNVQDHTCGNGIIECNETCDDGAALNGQPGKCNSTCTTPSPTTVCSKLNFGGWANTNLKTGEDANPTKIRAVHFQQIQKRIDLLRANTGPLGVGVFDWVGCGFDAEVGKPIRSTLITCPRKALRQVYQYCNALPANAATVHALPAWSEDPTAPSTPIRAKHIQEIRDGIENAYWPYP
jgi:hypothetical protein